MTNNYYAVIFVAALPTTSDAGSQKYRYAFVQPQTQNSSLTTIQALSPSSLSLGESNMLIAEYVFIGKIIIQYKGAPVNDWVITSVAKLEGTKISQIAIPATSVVASSVAVNPSGNIVATNVQTAIEELDTEKLAPTGSADDLTFTDTNSHYTTDQVGEALVQAGVEIDAKAPKAQEAWIAPTMLNGHTSVAGNPIVYRKDSFGWVEFKGRIVATGTAAVCTLPVGYRPTFANESCHGTRYGFGTLKIFEVATTGNLSFITGANAETYDLNGGRFYVG